MNETAMKKRTPRRRELTLEDSITNGAAAICKSDRSLRPRRRRRSGSPHCTLFSCFAFMCLWFVPNVANGFSVTPTPEDDKVDQDSEDTPSRPTRETTEEAVATKDHQRDPFVPFRSEDGVMTFDFTQGVDLRHANRFVKDSSATKPQGDDNEDEDTLATNDKNDGPSSSLFVSLTSVEELQELLLPTSSSSSDDDDDDEADDIDNDTASPGLWTLLVYNPTTTECPASTRLLPLFHEAIRGILSEFSSFNRQNLGFGLIPAQSSTMPLIKTLQLSFTPTIVFLKRQAVNDDEEEDDYEYHLWTIPYGGSTRNVHELQEGFRHFWSRLMHSQVRHRVRELPDAAMQQQTFLEGLTLSVSSMEELQEWVLQPEYGMFPATVDDESSLPLDPLLSQEEQDWIRSLWKHGNFQNQDHWVICRCEQELIETETDDKETTTTTTMDQVAAVLSSHHQVAFCIFPAASCPISSMMSTIEDDDISLTRQVWGNQSQLVSIYRVNAKGNNSTLQLFHTMVEDSTTTPSLLQLLARLLRPNLLWWDRQSTTPIAFAPYYKVHAVLIVDLVEHVKDSTSLLATVVAEFDQVCQNFHMTLSGDFSSSSITSAIEQDMVCLIVPSTETRVLTTFGIDIWSILDERVASYKKQSNDENSKGDASTGSFDADGTATPTPALPVLLLTNRTETRGVQRYYLDPPLSTQPGELARFVQAFWNGDLYPELHSTANFGGTSSSQTERRLSKPRQNSHGVAEWTTYHHHFHMDGGAPSILQQGANQERLQYNPPPHSLLMIYAPTCGHCKRLSIAWNSLGRLVRHLKWDSWLQVARLDVTREEFTAVGASLLPSVYYYYNGDGSSSDDKSESNTYPLWFQRREVGSLTDPLDIIDWLLDVGVGLQAGELLESLLTVQQDSAAATGDSEDSNDDDEAPSLDDSSSQ